MTGSGWNVKSERIIGGVYITPAFGRGSFLLPDNYLFKNSAENTGENINLRVLTPADTINNGDTVYVRMILRNDSNIAMYCRFKIYDAESNVEANYRFFFDDSDSAYLPGERDFISGGEWYYYANPLEPETEYIVGLEINIIKKASSGIIIGTPYADMIQARGGAVLAAEGWAETAEQNPGFFK